MGAAEWSIEGTGQERRQMTHHINERAYGNASLPVRTSTGLSPFLKAALTNSMSAMSLPEGPMRDTLTGRYSVLPLTLESKGTWPTVDGQQEIVSEQEKNLQGTTK
jgi:hypothetical protein